MKFETLDFVPAISYAVNFILGYLILFLLPFASPVIEAIPSDIRVILIMYLITFVWAMKRCKKETTKQILKKSFAVLLPYVILLFISFINGFIPLSKVTIIIIALTNPLVIIGLGAFLYKPMFNSGFKMNVC